MQIHTVKVVIILLGVFLFFLNECTKNPFDASEKVSPKGNKILGRVELSDRISPDGVYIWLEKLNIGTRTDKDGKFDLIIPPPVSQHGGGISGDLNLYFYVANYELETAQVAFFNGKVLYSHGDINKDGELKRTINLTKILDIKIDVEPAEFPQTPTLDSLTNIESELITVQLTLRTIAGSVNIKCSQDELGPVAALFITRIDPDKEFVEMLKVKGPATIIILTNQLIGIVPKIWSASFVLEVGHLERGSYKIIPYFAIPQESVPDELFESLGENVTLPIQTYLNLPMKREGGNFKVLR